MSSSPPIPAAIAPPFGRLNKPAGVTEPGQRADFRPDPFEIAIAAHGYRLCWTRRAECPCAPVSYQLAQPSPVCPICNGDGFLYFGASTEQDLSQEGLTDVQQAAIARGNGFLIRGIMTGLGSTATHVDKMGFWNRGTTQVTVVADNRLGYKDKIINIDGIVVYSEVLLSPADPSFELATRYVVSGGVYLCRSVERSWVPGIDFTIVKGVVTFYPGRKPAPGTRLTLHYATFPTYIVSSLLHHERTQNILLQTKRPVSPEGNLARLPLQAQLELEFLPDIASREGQ